MKRLKLDALDRPVAVLKRAQLYDSSLERLAGGRWVTMSNALNRAAHGLTLAEKRLLMLAMSKLDSRAPVTPDLVVRTKITAAEYAEAFEVEPTTAYAALAAAGKALYKRSITFFVPAHKRLGKPLQPTMVQMRWVGSAKYQAHEGWIDIAWWPELMHQLMGQRRHFTSYQLKQATALRSAYSWRLLELLTRYEAKGKGWAEFTVEDFAVSMDATEKQKQNFAAIRRKIIEPAVAELSAKDGWIIDWQAIKAGKKVDRVRFDFGRNPNHVPAADPQGSLPF